MRRTTYLSLALTLSWVTIGCGGIAIIDGEPVGNGGFGGGASTSGGFGGEGGGCFGAGCGPCMPTFELIDGECVCPEPYHVLVGDNCTWSCSEGTQPDNSTNECECQPGLTEVGTDRLGRRVCE